MTKKAPVSVPKTPVPISIKEKVKPPIPQKTVQIPKISVPIPITKIKEEHASTPNDQRSRVKNPKDIRFEEDKINRLKQEDENRRKKL